MSRGKAKRKQAKAADRWLETNKPAPRAPAPDRRRVSLSIVSVVVLVTRGYPAAAEHLSRRPHPIGA